MINISTFLRKVLLISLWVSLASCDVVKNYTLDSFYGPKAGTYVDAKGQKYKINFNVPTYMYLESGNSLCISFSVLRDDPDDNGDYNLKGHGCKDYDYELGRKWTGKYSTKQTDRFQFIQPNGETLEIIYAE